MFKLTSSEGTTAAMAPRSPRATATWISRVVSVTVVSLVLVWAVVTLAAGPSKPTSMKFQVLQYNLFGRPSEVSADGQSERLTRVPEALLTLVSHDIDVVTFAEADIQHERDDMLEQFRKHGFAYATSILHDPDPFTSLLNGGVLVVSKWPIVREAQHVYRSACHYSDCLAAKGVKYARVLKTEQNTSKIFNVFATHMQAWSTPQGRDDRVKQAQQMREFVDALQIPHHEPVIFAGDFNVDNHTFVDEVKNLVELLGANVPRRIGAQEFTSDPRTNVLVGRDGAANSNKCSAQYEASWGPPINGTFSPTALTRVACQSTSHATKHRSHWRNPFHRGGGGGREPVFVALDEVPLCYCPCCPREWLDYVLYAKVPYQQPLYEPTLESFPLRVAPPFAAKWSSSRVSSATMNMIDLSDHYPVLGKFEFAVDRSSGHDDDPLSVHLDGCSTDADCRFRAFRCYCAGDECFFQGKRASGWDQDSYAPINRNCLLQKTSAQCLCGPN